MRRVIVWAGLAAAALGWAFAGAGCGGLKGALRPDAPPSTRIFVQGPVDTVNHVVHLYWFGTDVDGHVVAFEVRLLNPADTIAADTLWRRTTRSDSVITVFTPNGFTSSVFEVRAIDDKGLRDPNPARQSFKFGNVAPQVTLTSKPAAIDSTFESVTVGWSLNDPDGDAKKVTYRLWLDGSAPDSFETTTNLTFTMPTHRFLQNGQHVAGYRWLFVQAIDDGGMVGPPDSVRWFVRSPVAGSRARLLIIDDVPTSSPANTRNDSLFANAAAGVGVPSDQWSIVRLQTTQPFKSSKDVEQTMKLFETVVWYRGSQAPFSTLIQSYQDGIGAYLDAGGKLYLESLNLVSTQYSNGSLTQDFCQRYLRTAGMFNYPLVPDSSSLWGINTNAVLRCPSLNDSLVNRAIVPGLNAFIPTDPASPLIVAPVNVLSQGNPVPMPVALSVAQPSGGLLIANTFPLVNASAPPATQRASAVIQEIYRLLGLGGP